MLTSKPCHTQALADEGSVQVLEINEFISLLKRTPMRLRQHDAIVMFHELAVRPLSNIHKHYRAHAHTLA
jgi:hypothetical protein